MKKLMTIAGLAGLIVSGAFAQANSGVRTQYAGVGVSVDTYMNLSAIVSIAPIPTPNVFTFHVTDGGFWGPYADGLGGRFVATSNVVYTLTASVLTTKPYEVQCNLDATGWADLAKITGLPITPGATHTVTGQLMGNPTVGLPPDAGSAGVLTVTIAAG